MLTKEQIEVMKYCKSMNFCCECKYAGGRIPCEIEEVDALTELLSAYDRIAELEGQLVKYQGIADLKKEVGEM